MFLRTFSGGICVLLASCGGPPDSVALGNAQQIVGGTPAEASTERVACAIGQADYADVCTIERTASLNSTLLTIRNPDGGFRRLRQSADGKTIVAADGALPAEVIARSEVGTEIAIGDARYRLPPSSGPR